MRFSEWQTKMDEQQKRLDDLALSEATESISIAGRTVTITLGKGKYESAVNGCDCAVRFLRPLYTNHKEEFDAMLESITQQTDTIVQATEIILESVSDEALPQAVIARMKGDKVSGDPPDLVKSMTEKKMVSLLGRINDELPLGTFASLECNLGTMAGKDITIGLHYEEIHLQWGRITGKSRNNNVVIPDIEEAIYFLANYDIIKKRFLEFIRQVKAIK